jgi:hypothetical protein
MELLASLGLLKADLILADAVYGALTLKRARCGESQTKKNGDP